MATRLKTLLALSALAIPCLAFAHNGRDVGPSGKQAVQMVAEEAHALVDIFDGIAISVDPRTGVRTYTQVGDVPANPARAKAMPLNDATAGPGVDYWVQKDMERVGSGYLPPAPSSPSAHVSTYDEGYYDYLPTYGYGYGYGGGRPGRGHGGGGGRPDRPGHGGGGDRPSRPTWSPPPGPPGGGVGSPPPYNFSGGVGSPPQQLRYNTPRGRRS